MEARCRELERQVATLQRERDELQKDVESLCLSNGASMFSSSYVLSERFAATEAEFKETRGKLAQAAGECDALRVLTSASNKDFVRIQWNRLEPIGVAPCNQIIASGFGKAGIKAIFYRYFTVFGRPATPFRGCGAPGGRARPAQRPSTALRGILGLPDLRTVKTINSSRWRGLKRESEHRLEPMEGRFLSKIASLAALANSNNRLEPIN
jgi:hypothetical protein